ncbi:MAG: FMN-binding protein [Candidatus Cloacimonadales bacterium]
MAKEKKLFRESRIYPILFMIFVTAFFIGILATFYQLTAERVNNYQEMQLKTLVLSTFDLPTDNVEADFQRYINLIETAEFAYYQAEKEGEFLGYCFPISGSGLWGTIDALLAVTPDLKRIINLEIVTQNETPGLGGRITEAWFKDQFADKLLFVDETLQKYQLVAENETLQAGQISQITGATASSKAVVDIIYKNMQDIEVELRAKL